MNLYSKKGFITFITVGIAVGPAIPTMTGYERKVQESSSYSVHEAGCLIWSSVYPGSPKSLALMPLKEWTCL